MCNSTLEFLSVCMCGVCMPTQLCICAHSPMYERVCLPVHAHVETRGQHWVSLSFLWYFLKEGFSLNLSKARLAREKAPRVPLSLLLLMLL